MVKPWFAENKEVLGEIRQRLIDKGFSITEESFIKYTKEAAAKHYKQLTSKPFYPELELYITSGKAYGMVVEGEDSISYIHDVMAGKTSNPAPGTIRYDIPEMLGVDPDTTANVVHSSDSEETANAEIEIFRELAQEQEKSARKDSKETESMQTEEPELSM